MILFFSILEKKKRNKVEILGIFNLPLSHYFMYSLVTGDEQEIFDKYFISEECCSNFYIDQDQIINSEFNSVDEVKRWLSEYHISLNNISTKYKMESQGEYLVAVCFYGGKNRTILDKCPFEFRVKNSGGIYTVYKFSGHNIMCGNNKNL